jgi:hypothetical protein
MTIEIITLKIDDEYRLILHKKYNFPNKLVMNYISCSFKNTGITANLDIEDIYFQSQGYYYKDGVITPNIYNADFKYNATQLNEFYDKFKSSNIKDEFDGQRIFNFLNNLQG